MYSLKLKSSPFHPNMEDNRGKKHYKEEKTLKVFFFSSLYGKSIEVTKVYVLGSGQKSCAKIHSLSKLQKVCRCI